MNLTDEQLEETVAALNSHATKTATADALGIDRKTLRHRLAVAAQRGMLLDHPPAMPGYRISQITTRPDGAQSIQQRPEHGPVWQMPPGLRLKGVTVLRDAEGRVMHEHVMAREGRGYEPAQLIEIFKTAFADFEGRAVPTHGPEYANESYVNLIPCNDWHINLLTWWREVGESWDLKIAERTIGDAIYTVIQRTRLAGTAIVLGGGDLMHNDDNTNRTAKSHNVLEADGRHQKGIEVAQRLKILTIDAALCNHKRVIVRILQGNHDEYSSVAIAHFLAAWYRNEPRVTVDLDASLFWYYQFGSVMLAATHGHTVKLGAMPSIMAHRRPDMWGASKFRYAHGFHIHHKSKMVTEGEGVVCESHQAPVPQDSWHYGSGYLSGRSVQTITYHRDMGEVSRAREAILDAIPLGVAA